MSRRWCAACGEDVGDDVRCRCERSTSQFERATSQLERVAALASRLATSSSPRDIAIAMRAAARIERAEVEA